MKITLFDNVMATINKLKNQNKRSDMTSINKEFTKNLGLNNIAEDHFNNVIFKLTGRYWENPKETVHRFY